MKKILVILTAIISIFVFSTNTVRAQEEPEPEFDYDRAYQDYVFVLDQYEKFHSEYLLARSQYLQAGTLVSQNRAQEATVRMLEARDDVVTAYLTAIRMRLLEAEGVSNTTRDGLFDRLDAEIAWYKDHKSRISSAGTLQDLVEDSEEARDRFDANEAIVYETLAVVPIGKVGVLRAQLNIIFTDLKNKTFEVRANGDHDVQVVERWISQTDDKITRSLDKELEAQNIISSFVPNDRQFGRQDSNPGNFDQIISLVQQSHQFLREASKFMREIITGLRTV